MTPDDREFIDNKFFRGGPQAIEFQQLVVDGTVKNLTVPTGATCALIEVESSLTTAAVRWLEVPSGVSTVSSTNGMRGFDGQFIEILSKTNLTNFQVTQVGAGTHYLNITYYIA